MNGEGIGKRSGKGGGALWAGRWLQAQVLATNLGVCERSPFQVNRSRSFGELSCRFMCVSELSSTNLLVLEVNCWHCSKTLEEGSLSRLGACQV